MGVTGGGDGGLVNGLVEASRGFDMKKMWAKVIRFLRQSYLQQRYSIEHHSNGQGRSKKVVGSIAERRVGIGKKKICPCRGKKKKQGAITWPRSGRWSARVKGPKREGPSAQGVK